MGSAVVVAAAEVAVGVATFAFADVDVDPPAEECEGAGSSWEIGAVMVGDTPSLDFSDTVEALRVGNFLGVVRGLAGEGERYTEEFDPERPRRGSFGTTGVESLGHALGGGDGEGGGGTENEGDSGGGGGLEECERREKVEPRGE